MAVSVRPTGPTDKLGGPVMPGKLYSGHLGFWPMRKTNTLLCLEKIKPFFVYSTQTD